MGEAGGGQHREGGPQHPIPGKRTASEAAGLLTVPCPHLWEPSTSLPADAQCSSSPPPTQPRPGLPWPGFLLFHPLPPGTVLPEASALCFTHRQCILTSPHHHPPGPTSSQPRLSGHAQCPNLELPVNPPRAFATASFDPGTPKTHSLSPRPGQWPQLQKTCSSPGVALQALVPCSWWHECLARWARAPAATRSHSGHLTWLWLTQQHLAGAELPLVSLNPPCLRRA